MSNQNIKKSGNSNNTLKRKLSSWHVLGISMADASPAMAVLLLSTGVFSIGGTFAIGASLILAAVIIMISLTLAELSSMYPYSGGMYSIISNVLPKPLAWIAMFNFLIQGVILPASFVLGVGQFLKDLIPSIPVSSQIIGLIALTLIMVIAIMSVELGAWVVIAMIIIQAVVVLAVVGAAIVNPNQAFIDMTFNPTMLKDGVLVPVTLGVMITTLAPAFSVINGYDAVLGFAEELKGGPKVLAHSVIKAAILACVFIIVPLIAGIIAAPNLVEFFSSNSPIVYSVQQAFGSQIGGLITIGVIFALFNAGLSIFMYFSRVLYSTGRDKVWTPSINKALSRLNKHSVPGLGVLVLFVPATVLIFVSHLNWLIIFAGTIISCVYFFIGLSGILSRIKNKDAERPFKMPLWPLPSVIVVLFVGFAIVSQETQYLIGELILAAVAFISYFVFSKISQNNLVSKNSIENDKSV
ncbi:APC family permease [Bacillus sp. FJAT-29790]|uniref:APC family permease n=1 Tax=Bacillus sp. FJAT-29790 TaxID=1895002 RepID=UPI001C23F528|nr:APC family permease [Bacillus sp. FJAT-29790]MBU8878195.1 APC family permease [Bacillus sp. FJAT-29790]